LQNAERKITELKHWEKELNISLEDNKKATAAMAEMNKRLNKLMEALGDYLHISQQCLLHRLLIYSSVVINFVYDTSRTAIKFALAIVIFNCNMSRFLNNRLHSIISVYAVSAIMMPIMHLNIA
jgi:Tektin family